MVAIIGLVPFIGFFAFNAQAWPIPKLNDSAVIGQYLLALPLTVALSPLVQARATIASLVAMLTGIVGICALAVVQFLWISGVMSVTSYYLTLGPAMFLIVAWLVLTGAALGHSTGTPRQSLFMSILAATYFAYPIWAIWLGRLLLSDKLIIAGPTTRGETL